MPDLLTATVSRRTALRRISFALGGIATLPLTSGLLGGCRPPAAGEPYVYQALTEPQQRQVAALVDRILPATDTPGAAEAGVPQFIDKMLAEWYGDPERAEFLRGLESLDRRAQAEAGAPFADLGTEAQTALLTAMDAEAYRPAGPAPPEPAVDTEGDVPGAARQGTYQAEQQRASEVAGTQGELGQSMADSTAAARTASALRNNSRAGTGETGGDPNARPPAEEASAAPDAPPFFRQLKELTLAGYYTSEVGATQELQWSAAPGRYDADAPLDEIGRAWA